MNDEPDISRRGIMLVLSSPSGAGKTTLTRNLLEQEENVALSVSVTTRPRRPERDRGRALFLPEQAASSKACAIPSQLLEWAEGAR